MLAAGTHRNTAGILDDLSFSSGDSTAARGIVEARQLAYVVTCGKSPPPGVLNWLELVSAPGAALAVYRVAPSAP